GADVVAFGEALGSLSAAVTVAGPDVTLSRLVIDKPQPGTPGRISATGSYNLTRSTYTLAFQSQDVRLLALTLPGGRRIRGNVQLSGKGAGSVGSPSANLTLAVDSLELDGLAAPSQDPSLAASPPLQLGPIVFTAIAANQQATIRASAPQFSLDADAIVGLSRPWPTTLSVRADELELE